jgi:beta-glucosidase
MHDQKEETLRADQQTHEFQNPDLPLEERIDKLIALLTLEEKIACLSTNPSVPRLGVEGSQHVEGLHGLALGGPGEWGRDRPMATTTFPQAIGLAETWDPEIVQRVAEIEGREARYVFHHPGYRRGGLVVRAPNADLGRDPRWGRNEECYGEDPFLNGTMAIAFVRGLQGEHPRYWRTAALLKHFLANSNENERERSSSDFDERLLREYYSVPFRMAIQQGGARAYMTAYSACNGIPCTTHPMLKALSVDEWGQDGIICTDGGAFRLLVEAHEYYPDLFQAAAGAIGAGITQFLDRYHDSVRGALERGLLAEADIDRAIRANFRIMIRLGLLDPPELVPYAGVTEADPEPWHTEAHKSLARLATQKSIVLLKNEALLPLDRRSTRSVAVIGPLADRVLVDWYGGTLPYAVTPLEGIRNQVGETAAVRHATSNDVSDAVRIAGESDVAIVCVGNHPTGDAGWAKVTRPSYGKEAVDRQSVDLEDERLVKKVFQANPRTIVVLISSFPYAIEWTQEHVPAIVHLTHNSQELGNALADVLFGDYNPGGRLVQTWPRAIEQLPPMMDYNIRHGRTYMYFAGEPLYPFGHGLSYTSFEHAALRISGDLLRANGSVTVNVDVRNTGSRRGEEVVQLYVRYPQSLVPRPRQELKGFRRVAIEPGETKTVELSLEAEQLAYWDPSQGRFAVERGNVEIVIGRSSSDITFSRRIRVSS